MIDTGKGFVYTYYRQAVGFAIHENRKFAERVVYCFTGKRIIQHRSGR